MSPEEGGDGRDGFVDDVGLLPALDQPGVGCQHHRVAHRFERGKGAKAMSFSISSSGSNRKWVVPPLQLALVRLGQSSNTGASMGALQVVTVSVQILRDHWGS